MKFLIVLFLALTSLFSQPLRVQQKLTNQDVIKMVKAGISQELIVETIKNGVPDFDLSSDGIIALKKEAVPDAIIQAMLARTKQTSTDSHPRIEGADCSISETDPLIVLDGTIRIELKQSHAEAQGRAGASVLLGRAKGYAVLKGARSEARITSPVPIFVSLYIPLNARPEDTAVLAKLDVKTDRREVQMAKVGFKTSSGVPNDHVIPITFEEANSQYCLYKGNKFRNIKITVASPLQPGEYCMIFASNHFFDFGVDAK